MNIRALIEALDEIAQSGDLSDDAVFIALYRDPEVAIDADDAWIPRPVARVELDDGDVDLVLAGDGDAFLTAADLREWYARESSPGGDIFVPQEWEPVEGEWWFRKDVPAIAPVFSPEAGMFGVMVRYEGYESELS